MLLLKEESDDARKTFRRSKRTGLAFFAVLTVLVWGSYLLISSIKNFMPIIYDSPLQKLNLVTPDFKYPSSGKIPLNVSAQLVGTFSPNYKAVQWIKTEESISDDKGTFLVKDDNTYLIKSIIDDSYNYTLYDGSSFKVNDTNYVIDKLTASPDLSKAILKTNSTHHWRHSSFAYYWILDVESRNIVPLFDDWKKISTVSWSHDSKKVAFVFDNNIFYNDLESDSIVQVTDDGSPEFFNGKPDWVYEEEIFATDIVLWWSPHDNKLAYLKSNDTHVPTYSLQKFVQDDSAYPVIDSLKYPKPGYPNPDVEVAIYDLADKTEKVLELQGDIDKDRLITEVAWLSDELLIKTSNRASDVIEIFLVQNGEPKIVRKDTTKLGWFEITNNIVFVPKNKSLNRPDDGYIDTVVDDGYNHLAYFSPVDSPKGELLTYGNWEVVEGVNAIDVNSNEVYFTSTLKSSTERHIHSVNLVSKNINDITTSAGYYSASFSSGSRYVLLTYQGPKIPYQNIIDLRDKVVLKNLETNEELTKLLKAYELPKNIYKVIDLIDEESGDVIKVNSRETLPLGFDPEKKYPVIFFTYGGPNSQLVNQRFAIDFSSAIAAELNSIVVTIDGRGTGFNNMNPQKSQFKFIVRDQLGKYEPLDQIAAGKLWSQKPYVDENRIGIWGWSYGGFLTLKTLEADWKDKVFSFGVSIAPVTEWRLYDSVYTERYMRTPEENPRGYETASVFNISSFSHVKRFFLAHGTGDDNVHYQNSLKLLDKFNLEGIENYDLMVFPDSDHSISFHGANKMVFNRIVEFFRKAFTT